MFDFIPVVFQNLFHRPATRRYPAVVREPYPGAKGHVAIRIDDCIFCGMCMRRCPTGAIRVVRAETSWSIDRFRCVCCNACVEGCPKKCLTMDAHRTPVATQKLPDVFHLSAQAAAQRKPPHPPARPAAAKVSAVRTDEAENRA